MIRSIWRYSHFFLALISALFLILASITGAILSFEPISKITSSYYTGNLNSIQLSEAILNLQDNYKEIIEIEVTANDLIKASVIDFDGENENIYVNPFTGERIGTVKSKSPFFSFVTNLHRSLFLKSIGRFFVGLFSLLLCFIAISGVFLLAQQQGGFKRWFSKVQHSTFTRRYHLILGRWFLIPIIIIALTGTFLSAEKFSLIPKDFINNDINQSLLHETKQKPLNNFPIFHSLKLNQVRKIIFPFSKDSEDYFELALNKKELLVNQYTGQIISEKYYPFVELASRLSLKLHTGQGNIIWSIILLLASLSLLFFIFSGFTISLKRLRKNKILNLDWNKNEAEYIILVGSETGNTFSLANHFYTGLKKIGKKVYISDLNEYNTFKSAKFLIVFTSTYGDGEAPSNSSNFEELFKTIIPKSELKFCVVGFGSLFYPKYCNFAIKVDELLDNNNSFERILPLVKINNQSEVAFIDWVKKWNSITGMKLETILSHQTKRHKSKKEFVVIEKTPLNIDNTTLLKLRPKTKCNFQSGDLLNIVPPDDGINRKYSIARIDNDIILSVKWHPKGICSSFLSTLKENDILSASIEINSDFHFPKKATSVWFISNGTGIAPFIGMINENIDIPKKLLWGGRTKASFDCYSEKLDSSFLKSKNYKLAFSQETNKSYVQDILMKQKKDVVKTIKEGGIFMLCGSLSMQNAVLDTLEKISFNELNQPISVLENSGQLLIDCY